MKNLAFIVLLVTLSVTNGKARTLLDIVTVNGVQYSVYDTGACIQIIPKIYLNATFLNTWTPRMTPAMRLPY